MLFAPGRAGATLIRNCGGNAHYGRWPYRIVVVGREKEPASKQLVEALTKEYELLHGKGIV